MSALPKPDWGREGETWRVEPEDAVPWRTDVGPLYCRTRLGQYGHDKCPNRAVAGYTNRRGEFYPMCEAHLNAQRMWIERGRVVSWRLSR